MEMAFVDLESELERLRHAEAPTLLLIGELATRPRSVALLSGSFDPMTVAHAALAEAASGLVDLVVLVYSARMLPKEGNPPPSLLREPDRLEVLQRFCRTHPNIVVGLCSHGLLADQISAARERFPSQTLFAVMGSDKVLQVLDPKWYEDRDHALEGLFGKAAVLYADRAGEEDLVGTALELHQNVQWRDRFTRLDVPAEVASISARSVRGMVAAGQDATGVVVPEARLYLPTVRSGGGGGASSRR
jgi:nicotinamide-nucleotide adenylyltransferase